MKKSFTIIAFFIVAIGFSQTAIKKSSIDSGGNLATNGTMSILYTVGEVTIQESTQTTTHISEGFISNNLLMSLGISDDYSLLVGVKVYPNPTTNFINLSFTEEANYTLTIVDYLGKSIDQITTEKTNSHTINITNFTSGVYLLVVTNQTKKEHNTFRILKE